MSDTTPFAAGLQSDALIPPTGDALLDEGAMPEEGYVVTDPLKHDWSFLNKPEIDDDTDSNETLQETMERRRAKAEAAETEKPDAGVTEELPVLEGELKPTEEKPVVTATPDAEVESKVKFADQLVDALHTRPGAVAQMGINAMSAEAKAAFFKSLGVAPISDNLPDLDLETYTPIGELEEALAARWEHIRDLPKMAAQIAELQNRPSSDTTSVQEQVRSLHEPLGYAVTRAEIAEARLDAICDYLGIDIASPDLTQVAERLKDGRTTHRSAVRGLTAEPYKKAVAEGKQAKAPRPQTPGNSSTKPQKLPVGSTLADHYRAAGLLK